MGNEYAISISSETNRPPLECGEESANVGCPAARSDDLRKATGSNTRKPIDRVKWHAL